MPGAPVRRLDAEHGEVAEHGSDAVSGGPGALDMLGRTARSILLGGIRAELTWLGRAEQTRQDACDEIWVAACEFPGVR